MTEERSSLNHRPESSRWEFDDSVTAVFDDMLERSIPGFEEMRRVVAEVGRRFVTPGSTVIDLGCALGGALDPFVRDGVAGRFLGIEVSGSMRTAAAARFEANSSVEVVDLDLRSSYPESRASLTLCVLTLQFTPIEYRQRILRNVYEHTDPGGALILVEKCLGATPVGDELLTETYLDRKADSGYSAESIAAKRRSLEGVLVPLVPAWNEGAMRAAGFGVVEEVWRVLNFAAWVAIR
jgi:tRNA (cmo5U34)-methyltransferase